MAREHLGTLLRLLRRRAGEEVAGALTDAQLLDRFVGRRDEAAFEALFWRHGPMVLAVCRRLLPPADAEDAFQATFLVLVRKAASIGRGDAVAAWLYRVAYRVALRARATARPAVELPEEGPPAAPDEEAAAWRELRPLLDEAIASLPEKYRAPVVLCYLQGKTNEEAARELGCPKGTVAVRLMRARERLRRRLDRCKLILPAALLGVVLAGRAQAAPVEAGLAQMTLKAALVAAAGGTLTAAASTHATALAEGVMRAMFLRKCKLAVAALIALGVIGGGGAWWHQHAATAAPPCPKDEPARSAPGPAVPAGVKEDPAGKPATDKEERRDLVDVANPREGIVLFVGSEVAVKSGEKPPTGAFQHEMTYLVTVADDEKAPQADWEIIGGKWYRPLHKRDELRPNKVRLHRAEKWFLPLKEGAAVQPGQLVALIDPSLAVDDLSIKLAKLDAAEADRASSERAREDYKERWLRADQLYKQGAGSKEDATAPKLSYDRSVYETISKTEGVKVAAREARMAATILEMYEVRSKVRGVVTKVTRHAGEGARSLDAVVQVRLDEK
ncbi:MAG TPA: sigma-70 family RNA polymerase sigma factor [Gemmataceae bacterium]|nr:sigma-70 family RNA polymerase sigma factor [Gemmataceae bacterium]